MVKLLPLGLVLLASAAYAATPLENAAALAAQLGAPVSVPPAAAIASPAASPAAAKAATSAPRVKRAALAGSSGVISGNAEVAGSGPANCMGGRMNAWINLRADVRVTTDDGAAAQFPVTGTVFLSGSCQRGSGSGFASGSAQLSGSGPLIKAGLSVGSASLSESAFINQYVNGSFVWINQDVSLSGSYSESGAAAK